VSDYDIIRRLSDIEHRVGEFGEKVDGIVLRLDEIRRWLRVLNETVERVAGKPYQP